MKRLTARAVGLAILLSALLVGIIYAGTVVPGSLRMSDTPGGAEMTQFPSEISVVYVVFDYSEMHNEEFMVRVYDNVGNVLFEQTKAYTESGTESVEVSLAGGGVFPDGRYVTNLYSGLFPISTIIWEVTAGAGMSTSTPTPDPATATPTLTPEQPTPTPIPPTATPSPEQPYPTPMPPTPTPALEQPTPTPIPPTATLSPEQPYPTPMSPTPTPSPEQPTLTPSPAPPMATVTETPSTPTTKPTASPTPQAEIPFQPTAAPTIELTPMPATPEAGSLSPTPTTALTPKFTPIPTATSDTTEGTKNFLGVVGYVGVAVLLISVALFLWQRRSS